MQSAILASDAVGPSCVLLLPGIHNAVVELVRIRGVTIELQHFGNEPPARPTFQLDYDVERISDIGFDCRVREIDPALKDAARETRESLPSGICVNRRERTRVAGVEELQKIEGLSTANFSQENPV